MTETAKYLNVDENNKIDIDEKKIDAAQAFIDEKDDVEWSEGFQKLTAEIKAKANEFNSTISLLKNDENEEFNSDELDLKIAELNVIIEGYIKSDEVGRDDVIKKMGEIPYSEVKNTVRRIIDNRPEPLLTGLLKKMFLVKTGEENIKEYRDKKS